MAIRQQFLSVGVSAAIGAGIILSASLGLAATILPSFTESSHYLGIHTGNKDMGADKFSVGSDGGPAGSSERSSLGRINETDDLPATAPPIPAPSAPPAQLVPDAPNAPVGSFDGNFALTNPEAQIDFSNTDTYAGAGPGQGVECAASNCVAGSSNSNFFIPGAENPDNTAPIGVDQGAIGSSNVVTENVNFDTLIAEIGGVKTWAQSLGAADFTATLNLSDGTIDNFNTGGSGNGNDFILTDHVTVVDGLNIIKVETNSNDFNIGNSNFIVNGGPNSSFVFIVEDANMLLTNSRILAGADMDLDSILFLVLLDGSDSGTHFNFGQSEIYGAAFWDLTMNGNFKMNNVRGCGQFVSNQLGDMNDVSLARCAFAPAPIPPPAALPLFLGALIGLGGLGVMRRRRKAA